MSLSILKRRLELDTRGGYQGGGGGGFGGLIGSIVNVALDFIAPPVGAAMHAVMGAYNLSQGNVLGAIGNGLGAYNVGGFGDVAGGGASGWDYGPGNIGDTSGGLGAWDFGPGNVSDGLGGGWDFGPGSFMDNLPAGADFGTGDFAYSLGGQAYSPENLPFNSSGIDIGQGNAYSTQDINTLSSTAPQTGLSQTYGISSPDATASQSNALSTQPSLDAGGSTGGTETFDAGGGNLGTSYGSQSVPSNSPLAQLGSNYNTPDQSLGEVGRSAVDKLTNPNAQDYLGRAWQTGINKVMDNPIASATKGLGTLYSMYQNQQAANALKKMASQADPFASQRGQYQQLLSQSYTNPEAIYNSGPFQGIQDLFSKQIAARDAAAGRNSQYGARAAELQNNFMNYLQNYQKNLSGLAGAQFGPGTGLQAGMAGVGYANRNPAILGAGLQNIFGLA